jgi:hypothetical protein
LCFTSFRQKYFLFNLDVWRQRMLGVQCGDIAVQLLDGIVTTAVGKTAKCVKGRVLMAMEPCKRRTVRTCVLVSTLLGML